MIRRLLGTLLAGVLLTSCTSSSPTEPRRSLPPSVVKAQPNHLGTQPSAIFAIDCKGRRCTFDATQNQDGSLGSHDDGAIVSILWDFDIATEHAGDQASGAIVEYRYPNGGCFNAQLTVVDNDGLMDFRQRSVCVNGPPVR